MKKKSTFIWGWVLFFATSLIIYSCTKKDSAKPLDSAIPEALLQAAKNWYEEQTHSPGALSINTGQAGFKLQPNWQSALLQTLYNGNSVIIVPGPITNLDPNSKQGVIRAFVFSTNGKSITNGKIVEIYGASDYITSHKNNLLENYNENNVGDFSGAVINYDVNYKYLNSQVFETGQLINATARIRTDNGQHRNNSKAVVNAVTTLSDCYDVYTVITYTDGTQLWHYNYSYCNGGDSTELGNGGTSESTGGGNNSNATSVKDITVNLPNPCLAGVVNQLVSSSQLANNVTNILRNTFGTNDQINVTFQQQTLTGNDATSDAVTTGASYNNFDITFNTPRYTTASKEFMAESAMHEIFHAYLYANPTIKGNLTQHQYMSQNYVNSEVTALRQMFSTLSDHDAKCMIIAGYGTMTSASITALLSSYNLTLNDVVTTNNSYQSGTLGTGCH